MKIVVSLCLVCILLSCGSLKDIYLDVTDESSVPRITNASVVNLSRKATVRLGSDSTYFFRAKKDDVILVVSPGYDSMKIVVNPLTNQYRVVLRKSGNENHR